MERRRQCVFGFLATVLFVACGDGGTSETHYERGKVLSAEMRSAEAMREYQLAVEAADDLRFVAMAHSELGHLAMSQQNNRQAAGHFEHAWAEAAKTGDTALMALAQRDLGRSYRTDGNVAEALLCYRRADSLMVMAGADTLKAHVYPEYLSLLLTEGQTDVVRQLMGSWHIDPASGPSCLVAGRFYQQLGVIDSAVICYEHCLQTSHVAARASAAMYLAEIAYDNDELHSAYDYAMECAIMVDSAKHTMQASNANLIDSLDGQLALERENGRLYRIIGLIVLIAVVLIAALTLFVRERISRLKREQEAERQARVGHARSQQEKLVEAFRNMSLYREILMNETVTEAQWASIVLFLDDEADGFSAKLLAFYPKMKPLELQACQLLKLEFTNQQIATLLCKTQQAITNLRKRLFQKMFEREGSADELNQFVRLFPHE